MDKTYKFFILQMTCGIKTALFVFSVNGPKQTARSLLTPDTQLFMFFHMAASTFFSMAAPKIAYFNDSDWLLKNFHH